MQLCFDSIDEVKSFVAQLKGTRGKKGEGDDEGAAAPTAPLQQTAASALPAQNFTPPQQAMQGFPGAAPSTPAANPLVAAIVGKIDQVIAGGQKPDDIANWFKTQIGPDAAQATLDQIKTIFIPRLAPEVLAKIAPQLGITG